MQKLFDFLGGRKMFFAILLFICATVFLYAVGNGAEHLASRSKE